MSLNQSRAEKSETHLRKGGRFGGSGNQRGFSGGSGRGGGAGSAPPPPSPFSSHSSSSGNSSQQPVLQNRRKPGGVHGGHSRVNPTGVTSEIAGPAPSSTSTIHGPRDGGQVRGSSHGGASFPSNNSAKPADSAGVGGPRGHSRPPHPHATADADSPSQMTPIKGDSSKGFQLQFGTISPGFVNGMQIPARTSSAPPNLDEQKHDQVPPVAAPLAKIQQLQQPKKEISANSTTVGDSHHPAQSKRDIAANAPGSSYLGPQKPSTVPAHGISMPGAYQQPQIPIQFGGPSPPIQPQGVTASSLPISVSLSMGNTQPVPPQIFVQSFPTHTFPQGMHQGLGFPPQMAPQLASQLGNLRVGMSQQYAPQQDGNFLGVRKNPVKITHPDTHEEVWLDKKTDSYVDQSQRLQQSNVSPYGSNHQMNYYQTLPPASYNPGAFYMQAPSSVPLTSSQMTGGVQSTRYNYPVSQTGSNVPYLSVSAMNHIPVNIARTQPLAGSELINQERSHDAPALSVPLPSASVQVTVKPPTAIAVEKSGASLVVPSIKPHEKEEKPSLLKPTGEGASVHQQAGKSVGPSEIHISRSTGEVKLPENENQAPSKSAMDLAQRAQISSTAPVVDSDSEVPKLDGKKRDSFKRHDSFKDHHKKPSKKEIQQTMNASDSAASLSSKAPKEDRPTDTSISSLVKLPEDVCSSGRADEISMATLKSSSPKEENSDSSRAGTFTVSKNEEISDSHEPSAVDTSLSITSAVKEAVSDDVETQKASAFDVSISPHVENDVHISTNGDAEVHLGNNLPNPEKKEELVLASDPLPGKDSKDAEKHVDLTVELVEGVDLAENLTEGDAGDYDGNKAATPSEPMPMKDVQIELEHVETLPADLSKSCGIDDSVSRSESVSLYGTTSSQLSDANAGSMDGAAEGKITRQGSLPELTVKLNEMVANSGKAAVASTGKKEKQVQEQVRPKSAPANKKKKMKDVLSRADAAGTNSDLYMAYKGPEEKKEADGTSSPVETLPPVDVTEVGLAVSGKVDSVVKPELDDWEDAVDISSPNLNAVDKKEARDDGSSKKYSRDFLLTFREQYVDLPLGFEIAADISDVVMISQAGSPFPSPGRIIDRPPSVSIRDRRPSSNDDDRWMRGSGRDLRVDVGGFRPGQAGHGVLRHPRGPINAFPGGILSAPVQAVPSPGGISRVNSDSDRWQRGGNQRGLIPSPQAPSQVMHKAEKRYEVGKVSDEEQVKQRQLKGILNKLTPQNFDRLFQQAIEVNIDNATTLSGVISQIFDKALTEPTFCEMYANFCFDLSEELPDFNEDNEKITFKRLLLNKCQEEFERGEREEDEASRNIEGESRESAEEREDKRVKARRRMLGNIRLIGELYKKKMLTERIMHECIQKLLGQCQNPDEEDIEALCKLMSTIGEIIDHEKAKGHMDAYFERMAKLSTNPKLSSRVRFMLRDSIDLRKNKWQQRRKVEGPKKIEEVHRDAAQERQAQTSRLSRGPGMGQGGRRGVDYGPRGSNPGSLSAGIRGYGPQRSGPSATQDARMDDRHPYVPLTQRLAGDDSITLGPQGGLARGMSNRGQPMSATSADTDSSRRPGSSSSNGYGRGLRSADSPAVAAASASDSPSLGRENAATESRQLSEEDLREKSVLAIKEYYSAKDEKELASCVRELGSPSAYPTVISLWITDSFERKYGDRDALSHLLVQLCKPHHSLLSPSHLSEGFRAVLDNLEETVTDAPKAGEFFGRMLARVMIEGVVSLGEIGRLVERAGEEPGRLVEAGLAAELLAAALETMRAEKGEAYLKDTCSGSGIRLESFQSAPPSKKLEPFLRV